MSSELLDKFYCTWLTLTQFYLTWPPKTPHKALQLSQFYIYWVKTWCGSSWKSSPAQSGVLTFQGFALHAILHPFLSCSFRIKYFQRWVWEIHTQRLLHVCLNLYQKLDWHIVLIFHSSLGCQIPNKMLKTPTYFHDVSHFLCEKSLLNNSANILLLLLLFTVLEFCSFTKCSK